MAQKQAMQKSNVTPLTTTKFHTVWVMPGGSTRFSPRMPALGKRQNRGHQAGFSLPLKGSMHAHPSLLAANRTIILC